SAEVCAFAKAPWEQIRVSVGIAAFNPDVDANVENVVHRADRLMYENKRARKVGR
ncbi:MAG: diguanylate cyclase, partial [Clostridia bacterium]|nr:diguanylate cyclase [Clostridia bacterium]